MTESYFHSLTYNLKRVINIMGTAPLIDATKAKVAEQGRVTSAQLCHFLKILKFCNCYYQIKALSKILAMECMGLQRSLPPP